MPEWKSEIRARLAALNLDAVRESEIVEEISQHLDDRFAELRSRGASEDEARRAVLVDLDSEDILARELGRVERPPRKEAVVPGTPKGSFVGDLLGDLKYASRMLRKSPGFTAVAVLTLALGIGVNTSMYSALRALLARSLPYPAPGSLVQVFQTSHHSRREPHHSVANFLDYQAQDSGFQFAAAMNDKHFNLSEAGQPAEEVRGLQVSADIFPLLGVQPELGRMFRAEEDQPGRNNVVILDHGFWLRRFAGDSNIIGRVIRLDGEAVTVVGVMPARFHDLMLMGPAYLWRPFGFTDDQRNDRGNNFLKCIARLKPGISLRQAQAATDVLAARLTRDHPDNSAEGLFLVPLAESSLPPEARKIVWSVMALAGFVLLIACANLANLQFARTAMRAREFAIRGALGASRRRLLGQLLAESMLLAFLGGLVGLVLAYWSNALLSRQFVIDGEAVLNLPLNLPVLGFALAAATVSGLVFGLAPAWLASRTDVNETLKQGARGQTGDRSQHRTQHVLVVAEVALAMVLLAGAGLVVSGLRGLAAADPGWNVDGMAVGYLTLPEKKYADGDSIRTFADRLEEKLRTLPGVEQVGLAWTLPARQFNVTASFGIDGRPEPRKDYTPIRFINGVTPGYFSTLGMQLKDGRDFTVADTINRPSVVIVNESMARAFWPDQSPVGQHIDGQEIVGVVSNVRFPANPEEPRTLYQTYCPFAQAPRGSLAVAVRGNVPAETLRRAVADLDADQPVGQPGTARADVGSTLDQWAAGSRILGVFALLGLSLAALGIYGVISGFVVRRTGEIGVRMALGAQLCDVLWLVVGKGLRLAVTGTAIGLLGAYGISRLLASILPELHSSDPIVIFSVAALLIAIALLACWLPARRAVRVEPMVALRNE